MGRVEVLEATRTAPNSRGRGKGEVLSVERIRVAAYCRVSTDDDDQLGSFESQKLYYEQKIRANKDWVNAGIFADEAITGTKVDKREGIQAKIQKCQNKTEILEAAKEENFPLTEEEAEAGKQFIAETEGLRLREIKQILRLAHRKDISPVCISEAIKLYKYGVPDDPWEDPDIQSRVYKFKPFVNF